MSRSNSACLRNSRVETSDASASIDERDNWKKQCEPDRYHRNATLYKVEGKLKATSYYQHGQHVV